MDIIELFKEHITILMGSKWYIKYDDSKDKLSVVNKNGEEISFETLRFISWSIEENLKEQYEEKFGFEQKLPYDEFTKRRFKLEDYVLVKHEERKNLRNVIEAYHDDNEIFTIKSFGVLFKNNLTYSNYTVHLTIEEAEKILPTLQAFVNKYKELEK